MKTIIIFNNHVPIKPQKHKGHKEECENPSLTSDFEFLNYKKLEITSQTGIFTFYNGLSGIEIARHIWATGLLSFPNPSFGFLK